MFDQREFIQTPMSELLDLASASLVCLKSGIETFPIREYVLQSLFLRMTGFQEQKMKCICWELAAADYEYRYRRVLSGKLGECSNYSDKCSVYNDLVSAIERKNNSFDLGTFTEGLSNDEAVKAIDGFYNSSLHLGWLNRDYQECHSFLWASLNSTCIVTKSREKIFGECKDCKNKGSCSLQKPGHRIQSLVSVFNDAVYHHRNRCAHNILAHCMNKTTFEELQIGGVHRDNYLIRFMLLLMIDNVITKLFCEWNQSFTK